MAVIYYPNSTSVYTRLVNGGLIEQTIANTPDTIFVFPTTGVSSIYIINNRCDGKLCVG